MAREQWNFHGTDLSVRGKWDVEEVLEGIGIPPYRGSDLGVPFQHGKRWIKKRFDRRKVVLSMWIKGANRERLDQHIDEFLKGIGTPGLHPLRRVMKNGEIREAQGELCAPIHLARKGPGYAKFALEIELADPFFYGTTLSTETKVSSGTKTTWTHANVGTAQAVKMKVTLTGPLSNPVLWNKSNDVWLQYLGSLGIGDTLVIDTKAFTALLNGVNRISAIRHGGDPYWMVLGPGNNSLELETGTVGGSAKVEYYPAFY